MRLIRCLLAPAIVAIAAGSAAADTSASSPFSLQSLGFETTVAAIVPAGSARDPRFAEPPPAGVRTVGVTPHGTRLEAIRYRARASRGRRSAVESPAQLHFGYFDPNSGGGNSFLLGLRGGPLVDPNIQIGGLLDWVHRSEDATVVAGDPYSQGGTVVTPTRVLSRASSNLFPMHLFLQVSGDQNMSVIPYGGISGGYQLMFLSADDFNTGSSYDATFGGWGWQAWAGLGIPLSGQSRLNAEFYMNESEPERDVTDIDGFTYRERVDADGVGVRLGLQWGF